MEDCRFNVSITPLKDLVNVLVVIEYIGNNQDIINKLSPSRLLVKVLLGVYKDETVLKDFYNYSLVTKYARKLKGAAHACLCVAICLALTSKHITPSTQITLNASGTLQGREDEDMSGLVEYYRELGFRGEYTQQELDRRWVKMHSVVSDVLDICKTKEISEELQAIIPQICNDFVCPLENVKPSKINPTKLNFL